MIESIAWRGRAALAVVCVMLSGAAWADCRADTVWIKGGFGEARFTVEIADDNAERARGLMHRQSMPLGAGMLFVYDRPRSLSFWMRNTLIPLDMIFVRPDGTIQRIHENAVPLDESMISGGPGLTHVLEINGGLSGQLGIAPGDVLRHPSFEQETAAWPC